MIGTTTHKGVELSEWELYLLIAKVKGLTRSPGKFETVWGEFTDVSTFEPEDHSLIYNF